MSDAPSLPFKWTRMPDGTLRARLYGLCVGGVRPVANSSPAMWYGWVNSLDRNRENVSVCYSEDGAKDDVVREIKALADPKHKVKK